MNSSQFMDKQIMDLSASGGGGGGGGGRGELFDLMNPQGENHCNGGGSVLKKEEILPSYDFHPMRTVGSSSSSSSVPSSSALNNSESTNLDAAAASRHSWGPSNSKIPSSPPNLRHSNILEPREPAKASHDKDRDSYDVATVAEIDRTVKKYADNLLHTLEGVSARLSQLESRTHRLEGSVDELKVSVGDNSGSNDGKMRQLENILREVQTGVQVLRDKQEIAEAQLELTKLQQSSSKADDYQPLNEPSNTETGPDSRQQQTPPPHAYQPPPPPVAQPQPPQLPLPTPNAPLPSPLLQQNPPQYPPQLHQTQFPSLPSLPREPSYLPPQGAHPPPSQAQPQAHPPPQQHYQPPPQYSQPMPPTQFQPPLAHHPEESAPYMPQPPQTYPPNTRQPAPLTQLPPTGGPQYYGPSSGQLSFSSGYALQLPGPGMSDAYPYSSSPSHYNTSMMKPSPFSNSPPTSGGGSSNTGSYPHLPTAKILPQAKPTGSSSGEAGGNRTPVDDVVDKVATMGFSREQVRATVRKLTESGQSVDLNVVLDKLMNDGGEMLQPQKGWFGQ